MRNAGQTGVRIHRHGSGTAQYAGGVEYVVYLLVLEHAVGVYAGAGRVEVAAHKRRARGYRVAYLVFEVLGYLGYRREVHAVHSAAQRGVLHRHGLQRAVAGALAYAQQRAVDRGAAVQPRGRGVSDHLVEVVVAVPLQQVRGHVGVVVQAVHYALHAARHRHARVGHAEAQRVAGAYLDGHAALARELHQLRGKGHHEAIEVGAGDVLKVAARAHAVIQRALDYAQVLIQRLPPVHVHLLEDVIVRAADQYAGLLEAHVPDQLEVLLVGPYPAGYLGELQPQLLAAAHGLAVLLGIDEELALAHYALGAAQARQQLVQMHDLVHREGRLGLLAVAECGVGYPYLVGHLHGHHAVVERDLGYALVIVQLAVQVRLLYVLQLIFIIGLHKQIELFVELQHLRASLSCSGNRAR